MGLVLDKTRLMLLLVSTHKKICSIWVLKVRCWVKSRKAGPDKIWSERGVLLEFGLIFWESAILVLFRSYLIWNATFVDLTK